MQNNISIDQKKQYLKSYRSTLWNIQLLEDEIHMFQSFSNTPSYIIHPVCGTQAFTDYTSYRTQIDTQITRLQAKRLESIRYYQEILQCISAIEDPTEQTLLRLKYIHGNTLESIAETLNYSLRQIHNIHRHALEHLTIPAN